MTRIGQIGDCGLPAPVLNSIINWGLRMGVAFLPVACFRGPSETRTLLEVNQSRESMAHLLTATPNCNSL